MLHLFLAATAATPAVIPDHETALLNAVDFCTQVADGGSVQMTYPGQLFVDFPADMAARAKLATHADVPDLIHRFSKTSPSGQSGTAEFANTSSQTGPVWISYSARLPICDVAVTGQDTIDESPSALIDHLLKEGWTMVASDDGSREAPVATYVLRKDLEENEVIQLRITKLLVGADPEGIQMDLQLMRGQLKTP